jgi:prepilin-type N-terminal cleavage/methylation domain-containing protein
MKIKKIINYAFPQNRGFTLIEMMVAVAIFFIVFVGIIGIFVSAIRVQRYSLASQYLLDQASYTVDYMSRMLRMAKKGLTLTGECLDDSPYNYFVPLSGNAIKFQKPNAREVGGVVCKEIYLDADTHQLMDREIGRTPDEELPLTSSKIKVTKFSVEHPNETQGSNQPMLTISLEMESVGLNPAPKIKIQTTISQRDLNIIE